MNKTFCENFLRLKKKKINSKAKKIKTNELSKKIG